MRLFRDRRRAQAAANTLILRRHQFREQSAWLHDGVERHQPAILVGGGLLAGWLLGRLSVVGAARRATTAMSLGATLMRSSLGPIVLATLLGRRRGSRKREADTEAQG
ncbi:MAG TPA: hypothetical protein PKC03_06010 [Dokdonella sp.]|nr:hypothetical protein [Dokdonella sp.]